MSTTKITQISIKDYLTASGKYPDRLNHKDLTLEHRLNAGRTVETVNKFLQIFNLTNVTVNSGWRPPESTVGAKMSAHKEALAIDLRDPDGTIYKCAELNLQVLEDLGLYMEHISKTPGWCHLQTRPPKSKNRIFYP